MKARLCLTVFAVVAFMGASTLSAADLKCPLSGKAVDSEQTADFNGGTVSFCCGKCKAAFAKNSEPFAAKANLQLAQSGQLKQVACPLKGKPCAADKTVDVDGVTVAFCCGGCLAKAKKASGDELITLLFKDTTKGFESVKK